MQYLEYVAVLATLYAINLYGKKNKHANDFHIFACLLWGIYGFYFKLYGVVAMNAILIAVNLKNYKIYKSGKHE